MKKQYLKKLLCRLGWHRYDKTYLVEGEIRTCQYCGYRERLIAVEAGVMGSIDYEFIKVD